MTLFTIDKITEKDSPRAISTSAYHPRRFPAYHPYPTVSGGGATTIRYPTYLPRDIAAPLNTTVDVDSGGTTTSTVITGAGADRLSSTGGSPFSPGAISSDGGSSSPELQGGTCSNAEEQDEHTKAKDKKPPHSYIALIAMAILASDEKRLLLCDIYQFIQENYPFYRNNDRSWRNSIRHNLSLNECFIKCGRSGDGRGNYWAVHPANAEDFARGDFHRRRARRRVRASDLLSHGRYSMYHPYGPPPSLPAAPTGYPIATPPVGFVPMTMTTLPPYAGVYHQPPNPSMPYPVPTTTPQPSPSSPAQLHPVLPHRSSLPQPIVAQSHPVWSPAGTLVRPQQSPSSSTQLHPVLPHRSSLPQPIVAQSHPVWSPAGTHVRPQQSPSSSTQLHPVLPHRSSLPQPIVAQSHTLWSPAGTHMRPQQSPSSSTQLHPVLPHRPSLPQPIVAQSHPYVSSPANFSLRPAVYSPYTTRPPYPYPLALTDPHSYPPPGSEHSTYPTPGYPVVPGIGGNYITK